MRWQAQAFRDELEYHDLHAVSVAIVKYRFGGSPSPASNNIAESGCDPGLGLSSSSGSLMNVSMAPVLPRQGTTLLVEDSSRVAVRGGERTARLGPNGNGAKIGEKRKEKGPPPPSSVGTAIFYAEDMAEEEAGRGRGSEGIQRQNQEQKWNYGGAAARDAKNLVSRMVIGKESLPGQGQGQGRGQGQGQGQAPANGKAKRRESHWDSAIRNAGRGCE